VTGWATWPSILAEQSGWKLVELSRVSPEMATPILHLPGPDGRSPGIVSRFGQRQVAQNKRGSCGYYDGSSWKKAAEICATAGLARF
jgi:hypothetical protein